MNEQARIRRLGAWGFEGESLPPSPGLLDWLGKRIGSPGPALGATPPEAASVAAEGARKLPEMPLGVTDDPGDRLAHARGQGLPDLVRIRSGTLPALPDGVCRPGSDDQVEAALGSCSRAGVRVIPWGGGTSVTGGVNVIAGDAPVLTMDLERLAGLQDFDPVSGLATFGAGTTGPAVEAALGQHGFTLGHFPQSWELATVGGWLATRSSGQESLGYGRIEDLVAGLDLVAPKGRLTIPVLPASAAGPDLRQLVMGSEGRLGVITRATLRVRPRPLRNLVEAALFPDLDSGLEAARKLVQDRLPLTLLRLSDGPETEVAMQVGLAASRWAALAKRYLGLRGIGPGACLMLYGAAGSARLVGNVLGSSRQVLRRHGAVILGRSPGRHWQRDRFRHPYLRDGLLDIGYVTDTFETAVPWAAVAKVRKNLVATITGALAADGQQVAVLSHVSHPYPDGASLYFTFFFTSAASPELTLARWATIKRAANQALVANRATLSHHHGIGQWHAPWLAAELGSEGWALLAAAARHMDPDGVLNPHVLLDQVDRLEE